MKEESLDGERKKRAKVVADRKQCHTHVVQGLSIHGYIHMES